MDKVLICLEIPAVGESFEMYVPDYIPVRNLLPLLIRSVKDLSGGLYVSSGTELLCVKGQDTILDENASLSQYDIGTGDHLILL